MTPRPATAGALLQSRLNTLQSALNTLSGPLSGEGLSVSTPVHLGCYHCKTYGLCFKFA